MKYDFSLKKEDDLIIVNAQIGQDAAQMVLDTAANQTVMDLNTVLIMGYNIDKDANSVHLETANGLITAQKLHLNSFTALGITLKNYEVLVYDFLLAGITSPYDGLLGLDFFKETVLTLDFKGQKLWVAV
mgnify:CR=1 FL=1